MSDGQLLFGFHAVSARLRAHPDSVREIFLDAARQDPRARDLLTLAQQHGVKVVGVDEKRLEGLARGERHQGSK